MAIFGPCTDRHGQYERRRAVLTAVYQYEVQGGLTLQPNLQFIRHPGGGATNPIGNMPGVALKDALVLGLRTVVKF